MNNNNPTQPFARKVGFFGSVKQLGVTTVSGLNTITIDTVTTATGLTGATAIASTLIREATSIWGNNMLADLHADAEIDAIHREIGNLQQASELDALKAELAKVKATRPVGRPAKAQ